jgi:hypothetical protein
MLNPSRAVTGRGCRQSAAVRVGASHAASGLAEASYRTWVFRWGQESVPA